MLLNFSNIYILSDFYDVRHQRMNSGAIKLAVVKPRHTMVESLQNHEQRIYEIDGFNRGIKIIESPIEIRDLPENILQKIHT